MTNQEAFTTVKTHLLAQMEKSVEKDEYQNDYCVYRSKCGCLKCAIGALIPDNLYDPAMESKSVDDLINDFPGIRKLFHGVKTSLLNDLQVLHDDKSPANWESELRGVASHYNLKF